MTIPTQALEAAFTALLERLQPKPEYVRLFKEIVLDVWRQRQKESLTAASAIQRKVEELEARLERLHEAFLHERSISQDTYRAQEFKTKEALTLAKMELQDAKATECDVEGVLAFAEGVLSKAARLWLESASDQKQRFQRILFPQGVEFLAGEYGTATTSPLFKLLQPPAVEKSELATLTLADWKQTFGWLSEMLLLRSTLGPLTLSTPYKPSNPHAPASAECHSRIESDEELSATAKIGEAAS